MPVEAIAALVLYALGDTTFTVASAPGYAEDQAAAVERLEARGADCVDLGQGDSAGWVVLRDPEGNEFCLLEPRDP